MSSMITIATGLFNTGFSNLHDAEIDSFIDPIIRQYQPDYNVSDNDTQDSLALFYKCLNKSLSGEAPPASEPAPEEASEPEPEEPEPAPEPKKKEKKEKKEKQSFRIENNEFDKLKTPQLKAVAKFLKIKITGMKKADVVQSIVNHEDFGKIFDTEFEA